MLLNASLAPNRAMSNHPGAGIGCAPIIRTSLPIRPRPGQELRILGVATAMVRALYPVAGYRRQTSLWS